MLTKKPLIFILFIFLLGCQQDIAAEKKPPNTSLNKKVNTVSMTYKGTIQFFSQEGGFYGIITSKGEKLLPMNLAKQYQQDGAEVEFSGNYKNVMTIQQWGKPFTISKIKLIKSGKRKTNPEI